MVNFCEFTAYSGGELHNFTAFTAFHRKSMYEICGEETNFSPLILHIFPVFSRLRTQAKIVSLIFFRTKTAIGPILIRPAKGY